jgi:hypothetical protein
MCTSVALPVADYLSTLRDDEALGHPSGRRSACITLALKNGEYVVDHSEIQLVGGLEFKGSVDVRDYCWRGVMAAASWTTW